MNYSETYFELDSEEATHCHHCYLICCVYIKGLVNTKDQSNACMCEMMPKGSKEALTVFMSKGSKVILTFDPFDMFCMLCIHAMYVERVESYFDFRPLRHVSTHIALDGMVGKV